MNHLPWMLPSPQKCPAVPAVHREGLAQGRGGQGKLVPLKPRSSPPHPLRRALPFRRVQPPVLGPRRMGQRAWPARAPGCLLMLDPVAAERSCEALLPHLSASPSSFSSWRVLPWLPLPCPPPRAMRPQLQQPSPPPLAGPESVHDQVS
jgi:hypothetical protein